jgi:hypothetical protein
LLRFVCFIFCIAERKYIEKFFSPNPLLIFSLIRLLSKVISIMRFLVFFIWLMFLFPRPNYAQPVFVPLRYEVVISEIMADPNPPLALPNAEYIELKNRSGHPLDLSGWTLTTSSASSGTIPKYLLPSDSFLILTSTSNVALFQPYGKTLGIPGFPALANEGSVLSLVSRDGRTIHAVPYSPDWYASELKAAGGWSLEMIDTNNPCSEKNNWTASVDAQGGTPGRQNAVHASYPDAVPPRLLHSFCTDSTTLIAVLDEPVDSAAASITANYALDKGLIILSVAPLPPLFLKIQLRLQTPVQEATVYELSVKNIRDCAGNTISMNTKVKAGWASEPGYRDLVINEILFNPRPNGSDYVECYNNSHKVLDAGRIYLGNRNAAGNSSSLQKLSEDHRYIFPGDYILLTGDDRSLKHDYLVKNEDAVLVLPSFPSYPDDKGDVLLMNFQGLLLDELVYSEKWHFPLITNAEGVSLERIDPLDSTQKSSNWHSAATSAGYGTPTYRNSQYKAAEELFAAFEVHPRIFSPDNDGRDDITSISYRFKESGYVANLTIFDDHGRRIRALVRNGLTGITGSWNWDGLGESGQNLRSGIYIILAEVFNLNGRKHQFKLPVVVAGK